MLGLEGGREKGDSVLLGAVTLTHRDAWSGRALKIALPNVIRLGRDGKGTSDLTSRLPAVSLQVPPAVTGSQGEFLL